MKNRKTTKERILQLLQRRTRVWVTGLDFIKNCNLIHYTKPISTLRAEGHKIESVFEHNKDTGTNYVRYFYKTV